MDYSDNYGKMFGDLAQRQVRKRLFPNDLIQEWSSLIDNIIDGYEFIHVELDYDLEQIRDTIETFLVVDDLNAFPEHKMFKHIITKLDQQYLDLTQEYPKWKHLGRKWWSTRILKFACKEYVDFLITTIREEGLTIQVVNKRTIK